MPLSQLLVEFARLGQRLASVLVSEQNSMLAVDLGRFSATVKLREQDHQTLHGSFICWFSGAKTIKCFDRPGESSTLGTQVREMKKEAYPTALQSVTASYSPI